MELIDYLIQREWLKTPEIIKAFRKIRRADFLPAGLKDLSALNKALPIGFRQTISQPQVVAFMLELLRPKAGDKVLDIGSGSGWTTALLGQIVGEKGRVVAMEILPELKQFGEKNVAKYNFVKKGIVKFICADGSKGYNKESPFDKILVSAAGKKIYQTWKDQVKIGGRIVAHIGNYIWLLAKKSKDKFEEEEFSGFVFVPLVENI